jgi:hypothetical protein
LRTVKNEPGKDIVGEIPGVLGVVVRCDPNKLDNPLLDFFLLYLPSHVNVALVRHKDLLGQLLNKPVLEKVMHWRRVDAGTFEKGSLVPTFNLNSEKFHASLVRKKLACSSAGL